MLSDNRRRVHDLYLMSVSLARAGGGERVLPEILPASRVRVDPFTSRPYEYRRTTASTSQICAVFSEASPEPPAGVLDPWHHKKGLACFELDSRADLTAPLQE